MSYTLTPTYGSTKQSSTSVSAYANNGGVTLIRANGASFKTNGVVAGDGAVITGSTSFNGTYVIVLVVSETTICVVGTAGIQAVLGSVAVSTGAHLLDVTDEATPSWSAAEAAVANPGYIAKELTRSSVGQKTVYRHCLDKVRIKHTGSTNSTWTSEDEVVFSGQKSSSSGWTMEFLASEAGTFKLKIGNLDDSADRRSYRKSSAWLNVVLPSNSTDDAFTLEVYGSLVTQADASMIASLGLDGKVFGSILEGEFEVPALDVDADVELQDVINISAGDGLSIRSTLGFSDNIIISRAATAGSMDGVTTVLSGLALGTDAVSPAFTVDNGDYDVRDAQSSPTPARLFNTLAGGLSRQSYNWIPRCVRSDMPDLSGGTVNPVASVSVHVWMVELERLAFVAYADVFPNTGDYTVTINGTAFTHNVAAPTSRLAVATALVTLINAGAEPVTATLAQGVGSDTDEWGVHLSPDNPEVSFTVTFTTTGTAWSVRNHRRMQNGSAFVTDAAGLIGTIPLEVWFHNRTSGGNLIGFNRRLEATFSHPDYQTLVHKKKVPHRLEEDVLLIPWNPLRPNPSPDPTV